MVIDLNVPPLQLDEEKLDSVHSSIKSNKSFDFEGSSLEFTSTTQHDSIAEELPEELSMLFVDDDVIVRKLFCRAVKKVAPKWTVHEASNGETALRLVDAEQFDLIFVDMYMASVEKQLTGTETVRELRAKGVGSRICGFSANDMEAQFTQAGADAFLIKPFPCEKELLEKELKRILFSENRDNREKAPVIRAS
jgi:CheY-like chemotaxis protein